jgi:hypothetical protein
MKTFTATQASSVVELDARSYAERRIAELQLCLILPRSWPQYGRPTNEEILERAKDEVLPWEHCPDEEFLLCGEEP